MHPLIEEWIADPFVRQALNGMDFAELESQLRARKGYLGVYPESSGTYLAYWKGNVPAGAPRRSSAGHEVRHMGDARVQRLIARASNETSAISLHELERQMADGSAEPMTPGPVQGIGPGGAIRMRKADANGNVLTYICSASYLFLDPASDTYYLGTAGHCLLDENVLSSTENANGRAQSIQLCYEDCVNNSVGLGKYVELTPDAAYPGYHPVAWAEQRGIGLDFGFIEIPKSLNSLLRPSLWFWGGPTGFKRPSLGSPLVHYGFGIGLGQAFPTQGRAAVTISSSKTGGQAAVGWVNGGDSGSAFGTAAPRIDEMLLGDGATGAITHAVTGVGLPLMWGTDIESALERSGLSTRLALVKEDGTTESQTTGPPSNNEPSPSPSQSPSASPTPAPSSSPTPTPQPEPSSSPTPSGDPSPDPSPSEPPDTEPPAARQISLRSSRSAIEAGDLVRLHGSISSRPGCIAGQPVKVLARRRPRAGFRKIAQVTSDGDGAFVVKLHPNATRSYRVVSPASESCSKAVSRKVRVKVTR